MITSLEAFDELILQNPSPEKLIQLVFFSAGKLICTFAALAAAATLYAL
jgi:hypothetical protein